MAASGKVMAWAWGAQLLGQLRQSNLQPTVVSFNSFLHGLTWRYVLQVKPSVAPRATALAAQSAWQHAQQLLPDTSAAEK